MMSPTEVNERVNEAQKKMEEAESLLGEAHLKLTELVKFGVAIQGLSKFANGVGSMKSELSGAINDMCNFRV